MSTTKTVTVRLDAEVHDRIVELAGEQRRTVSNFLAQFLAVSLHEGIDRIALFDKMNPSLARMKPAIEKERARLERLLDSAPCP